jgi:Domain of unknown function (DUF4411)
MGRYWVDANVFIWGSNVPYPFARARAYWRWFSKQIEDGVIVTHIKVYEEVTRGSKTKDEEPIIQWMKTRRDAGLRIRSSRDHQLLVGQICTRAFEILGALKAQDFIKGADPFLIAHARLDQGTVVTQENKNKAHRIPQLCREFSVPYINIYEMNDILKAEFGE